jgi:hypothetical protein
MNKYIFLDRNKISFLLIVILIFNCAKVTAQESEIYSPFYTKNSDPLDSNKEYCKNISQEKKLWTEINLFAKSFISVFPQIPPEQKEYMAVELASKNFNRKMNIRNSSFYRINNIYKSMVNVDELSTMYLSNINQLSLSKKIEFIGRTLLNVSDEEIRYADIENVVADLNSKKYFIKEEDLQMHNAVSNGIERILIYQLICYGENAK